MLFMKKLSQWIVKGLVLLLVLGSVSTVSAKGKKTKKEKKMYADFVVNFDSKDQTFRVLLYDDKSPKTVDNFVGLATGKKEFTDPKTKKKTKRNFYDGLVFHRVIKGFMIQGGDPLGSGRGGPGYKFEDEFSDVKFDREGLLAMANAGPNTNGSQFFITVAPTPHLFKRHTIFGEVVKGYDVVEKISKVETAAGDRPKSPVTLKSVKIVSK